MTYTETQQAMPVDWTEELKNPPGYASPHHEVLKDLAASWVTCACGVQCSVIPRDNIGTPKDDELRRLGTAFSMNINMGQWSKAKAGLRCIEKRSAELIRSYETSNYRRTESGRIP